MMQEEEQFEPDATGAELAGGAPLGALAAATQGQGQPDPIQQALERLGALTAEVSPVDKLRTLGAGLIPDASEVAAQRARRKAAAQTMIDAYLQKGSQPIYDPTQQLLIGLAGGGPRGTPISQVLASGLRGAETARQGNRQMEAARAAAAAKAGYEAEVGEGNELQQDIQLGAGLMAAGQPRVPKQFSVIVNEVLERRNQAFDKLVRLGVDASTPASMAAVEARIDREVAPLVQALMAEYPQYRDLIIKSMPQMFATYPREGAAPAPVTPAVTGARPTPSTPGSTVRTGEASGPPALPPSPFEPFFEPRRDVKVVEGMTIRNKAAEEARKANAKAASKYYEEVVRPGADSGITISNVVQQLRAIGPETSALAPAKRVVGQALDAIGVKDAFGLVDEAIKSNNSQMLLQQMANAILMQAKGVQTEGDAQRAFRQAAELTDPKEAFQYKLRAMEAASWRLRYRQQLYEDFKQRRDGNYDGADAAFAKFEERVPFVRVLPTRAGGKQGVFFHEYLQARQRQGLSIDQALKEWSELNG